MYRVLDEQLRRLYPDWVERYRVAGTKCAEELLAVAERFQNQLERLMLEAVSYTHLGLGVLRFEVGAHDLFRLSSVKAERGLSYPYARNINFSLSVSL